MFADIISEVKMRPYWIRVDSKSSVTVVLVKRRDEDTATAGRMVTEVEIRVM